MRNHFLRAAAAAAAGPVSTAWDLDYAEFTGTPQNSFSVENEESGPRGLFFKGDGTQMYVVGSINDSVIEYELSTAWDVSTASYTQSFSVNSQETIPCGLFFKPDGTKMYVIGFSSDKVNEYNLSTAWDVSTASYSQAFSVATEETQPEGVFFKDDGTEMYVCGAASDSVHQYGLSTAWDVSSASLTQTLSLSSLNSLEDVHFGNSGTKMYVCSDALNRIYEYTLSTAWDISTATLSNNYYINTFESGPGSISLKADGSKLYALGYSNDTVWQFDLSTNWSIASSSISYTFPSTEYLNVGSQEAVPQGISFKSDGTKMYVIGSSGDEVNEYSLSTAWDISTASYVQNFSVSTQDTIATDLFFKPDGTKMYVIGASSDNVNEYNLTTAWDVSTASYNQSFSVATQETNPRSISFKTDGTKMYMIGSNNRRVYEYNLSSAWDISTASYQTYFSVSSQDIYPEGLFFKDDGSKMYVCGQQKDSLYQYGLTTSWDVSTASYEKLFSLKSYETPGGIFFKSDGTKFFIVGPRHDSVWAFSIS